MGEHAAILAGALRAGGAWRVTTPQLAGGGMISPYLAPVTPQPCGGGRGGGGQSGGQGGGQGGGSGRGGSGDRGDRGGGGGLPLTELQMGYDSN